jgi:hypothetical protein
MEWVFMGFSRSAQMEEAAALRGWNRNLMGAAGGNHGPI